jgi:hypothetical protein
MTIMFLYKSLYKKFVGFYIPIMEEIVINMIDSTQSPILANPITYGHRNVLT